MLTFIRLAVLSLATTSAVAQYSNLFSPSSSSTGPLPTPNPNAPKSYEAWVQTLQTCYQPCQKQYFEDEYASSCGANSYSSTDAKDINCICQAIAGQSFQETGTSELKGSSCVQNSCKDETKSEEIGIIRKEKGLLEMCDPYISKLIRASRQSAWLIKSL
jgi:hypothetical protein